MTFRADVRHKAGRVKERLIDQLLLLELRKPTPGTRRPRITRPSTKLACIDHSFHEKTRSSAFFVEYLRQHFDVEVIADRTWSGVPLPDLSFLDDRYLGVVFFQTQPTRNLVDTIPNKNVIFVPMYDSAAKYGYRYWRQFSTVRMINFSSTLHDRLLNWGFESMHIQYFPKPLQFTGGSPNEVFYWQRVARVNPAVVAKLFCGEPVRIHIHKSMDPHELLAELGRDDEARFGVTYSTWFDTRESMLDLVRQKGIYIAPRENEGIGMSFLEAMAMGKAVVAVDNPTMNEYIVHMKTGYLFDLERPEKIDLSEVREVQWNAYQRVRDGHESWESNKHRIVDFIRAG